jgi:glycosyltransferase involved in cell wall biosynthesis
MTGEQNEKPSSTRQSVSVAMCTFNGSRFLREQLRSIASQTILPAELIVCDDASTDDTLSIIEDFRQSAPFEVRIFQNRERLGPAKNFENAIRACGGEIIFLSDQDDIWRPHKVERIIAAFDSNPRAAYAFSDADMVDEQGRQLGQTLWSAVGLRDKLTQFRDAGQVRILLKHNIVTGATMALRRSFRDLVLPIPSGWMHDYWIVLMGSSLFSGVPVPESLVEYRRHASQVCGWRKMTFLQVCRESLKARAEDWNEKVATFRELLSHLDSISAIVSCPPDRLRLIKEKERHLLTRSRTRSTKGLSRVARVLAEATTGRYQRFSDSWYSIVRDL